MVCIVKKKRFLIDREFLPVFEAFKWYLSGDYLKTGRNVYFHRLIMGAKKKQEVDHINKNPRDNRLKNLRFVTHQQNILNSRHVRGYFWDKKRKKYSVYLKKNYKTIFIGRFSTKEEAIEARRQGLKTIFPSYF